MGRLSVSVIIPTYNRADHLRRCLMTVLSQTRPADEVIVVADGSTDNTGEVVARCFEKLRQFDAQSLKYLPLKENRGKSVAVNAGLCDATGDLVWIMDDDDLACVDRLEKLAPLFAVDPALDVVHTDATWIHYGPCGPKAERWRAEYVPGHYQLCRMMQGNFWFGISVMWRRSLLDRLAKLEQVSDDWPFDPRLERAQDYDFWIRLAWAGAKVAAVNEITVTAHNHRDNRGIGGNIPFDQVAPKTVLCETMIFRKVYERIPLSTIWHGAVPGADDGKYECALVERAIALFRRSLLAEAAEDLAHIERPDLLYGEYRRAVATIEGWVDHLELAVTTANATTLDGKALPEEVQGGPIEEKVTEIRAHLSALRVQVDRIRAAWESSRNDLVTARLAILRN